MEPPKVLILKHWNKPTQFGEKSFAGVIFGPAAPKRKLEDYDGEDGDLTRFERSRTMSRQKRVKVSKVFNGSAGFRALGDLNPQLTSPALAHEIDVCPSLLPFFVADDGKLRGDNNLDTNLDTSLNTNMEPKSGPSISPKWHTCDHCGHGVPTFDNYSILPPQFDCNDCPKKFYRFFHYQSHLRNHFSASLSLVRSVVGILKE